MCPSDNSIIKISQEFYKNNKNINIKVLKDDVAFGIRHDHSAYFSFEDGSKYIVEIVETKDETILKELSVEQTKEQQNIAQVEEVEPESKEQ